MGRIDAESETLIPTIGGAFDVAHTLRGEGYDASYTGTGGGTPLVPVAYRTSGDGNVYKEGNVTAPMTTATDQNAQVLVFDLNQITSKANRSHPRPSVHHTLPAASCPPHLAFGVDGAAHTIRARASKADKPDSTTYVADQWAVRRLMPSECERLQGFPDGFTDVPYRKRNWTPDGPRYKALGNSMAVNVMTWLGERIAKVDAIAAQCGGIAR